MTGRQSRPAAEFEQLLSGLNLPDDWESRPAQPGPHVTVTVVVDPEQADLVAEGLALVGIPVLERDGPAFVVYRSGAGR